MSKFSKVSQHEREPIAETIDLVEMDQLKIKHS